MPSHIHHTATAAPAQAACSHAALWENEIVPHLPPDLEEQARILGAFKRRRALACATDLLRALLAFVLLSTSLQHLGAWAVLTDVADISAPAWHNRLRRSRPFLLWLLAELLAPTPPPLRLFPRADGNILLVDATFLRVLGGCGDDWRLHTAYNFTLGRLVQVTITDQSGGEHLGYYQLQPGDIVVADNGYGYRRSVAIVCKQQAHLVIRVRPSTFPFERSDQTVVDVVALLRKRGGTVRHWHGWCRDSAGERYRVRLIAAKLPTKEAGAARRRARANASRHGRKLQASTLLVAGWVLVITTLAEQSWDAAGVLRLYRVRWQIELVFKRLKSLLKQGAVRARSAASVEASLLALLIAWALQEGEAAWMRQQLSWLGRGSGVVVSSWKLNAVSVELLRYQVRGGWGQARLQVCLPRLLRFLTGKPRQDRAHQETEARAWLERRPLPNLIVDEQAA